MGGVGVRQRQVHRADPDADAPPFGPDQAADDGQRAPPIRDEVDAARPRTRRQVMRGVERAVQPVHLDARAGSVCDGERLSRGGQVQAVRGGEVAMIFQDPMTALNPVLSVRRQMTESLRRHYNMTPEQAKTRAIELLELVGIPDPARRLGDYPHQFSGGMRQRVMIAMMLACNPDLLIADEPTTALDVTIQAQIVELVTRMREQLGMALIWITHDLGVVAGLAERVIVMYAGMIVESGPVKNIYGTPHHPYTVGLLGSLPHPHEEQGTRLFSIKGEPPDLVGEMRGCPFVPRCEYKVERCEHERPTLVEMEPGHHVACWERERVEKPQ